MSSFYDLKSEKIRGRGRSSRRCLRWTIPPPANGRLPRQTAAATTAATATTRRRRPLPPTGATATTHDATRALADGADACDGSRGHDDPPSGERVDCDPPGGRRAEAIHPVAACGGRSTPRPTRPLRPTKRPAHMPAIRCRGTGSTGNSDARERSPRRGQVGAAGMVGGALGGWPPRAFLERWPRAGPGARREIQPSGPRRRNAPPALAGRASLADLRVAGGYRGGLIARP